MFFTWSWQGYMKQVFSEVIMTKQQRIAEAIKSIVSEMMERVMTKVLKQDPFIAEEHHAAKPL